MIGVSVSISHSFNLCVNQLIYSFILNYYLALLSYKFYPTILRLISIVVIADDVIPSQFNPMRKQKNQMINSGIFLHLYVS